MHGLNPCGTSESASPASPPSSHPSPTVLSHLLAQTWQPFPSLTRVPKAHAPGAVTTAVCLPATRGPEMPDICFISPTRHSLLIDSEQREDTGGTSAEWPRTLIFVFKAQLGGRREGQTRA